MRKQFFSTKNCMCGWCFIVVCFCFNLQLENIILFFIKMSCLYNSVDFNLYTYKSRFESVPKWEFLVNTGPLSWNVHKEHRDKVCQNFQKIQNCLFQAITRIFLIVWLYWENVSEGQNLSAPIKNVANLLFTVASSVMS